MNDILLFALIFIPMAIIIGIASACIGFTAWNIAVPLMFIGFGFPAYDAIYLSLLIDFVDSVFLTGRYAKSKNVDFRMGTIWGIISWIGLGIGFALSPSIVQNNEGLLRGGIAYFIFIMGFIFIMKGRKGLKKSETQDPEVSPKKGFLSNIPEKYITLVMIIGTILSGAMVGVVGVGSGMNFVILLILLYAFDTLKATGTGCYMMALATGAALILFGSWIHIEMVWPYLIIGTIFSLIGTIIGSIFALRIKKEYLNFLVGGSMIFAALIATIEKMILN